MYVFKSGIYPKGMTIEDIYIVLKIGMDLGISPMQAIHNIKCIDGKPFIWGDAALAVIRVSGKLMNFTEGSVGDWGTDGYTAVCTSRRMDNPDAFSTKYSVENAKNDGRWEKGDAWKTYPRRELRWKARAMNLQANFTDVLKGVQILDESREETKSGSGAVSTGAQDDKPAPGEQEPADDAKRPEGDSKAKDGHGEKKP